MERKSRKIIKRVKEIVIILIFPLFCYAQNIEIEEEILGQDLTTKKTEIFYILPIPSPSLTFPQLPEIKLEEKGEKEKIEIVEKIEIPEEKEKEKFEEKRKIYLKGVIGNFKTKGFDINYNDEKINLIFSNFYTENYRPNSEFFNSNFCFSLANIFNLDFKIGQMQLPGPITNPFLIERDFLNLKWDFEKRLSFFNFNFFHNFYSIDKNNANFFKLKIDNDFENFVLVTEIEKDIFENQQNFSISEHIILEKEKFQIKTILKFVEGNGLKFLPNFLFKINENFSFFLNSDFEIPDLWKDLIIENCKELKKERILPEEIYKGGIKFEYRNIKFELSQSYNKRYIWENIDSNDLYEPHRENFYQTQFLINSKIPLNNNLKIFFEIEKNFFEKEILYLPEYSGNSGIEFENKKIKLKIWNSFNGERKFSKRDLKSFSTLNFELLFKGKIETCFGLYNIFNQEYEIFPDYPGEKRKFLFSIRF
ncbi:MAG: hypothetical protein NC827_02555 [Candidatus Omnitrophica bacterium]|nr:hypothetical protein [Candidatus Omnitrophota bacterium]MCM8802175.1 hypothetical protein [Candidatus Omnitrophota bacterium]